MLVMCERTRLRRDRDDRMGDIDVVKSEHDVESCECLGVCQSELQMLVRHHHDNVTHLLGTVQQRVQRRLHMPVERCKYMRDGQSIA